ncbi:MAG: flagellar export protein FliJ [Gammaproteobacteria bacterium]|nr:MAG: flagellar export protein FliJ [Gammaproteobacteria bacterium]
MRRSHRFRNIAEIAQAEERSAAREMARWQQEMQRHEARLAQLWDFCQEYRQRFHEAGKNGIDGRQLQGYRAFMAQLESAIQQQQERIAQLRTAIEEQRRQWEQCRRKAQIMDKLVQRHLHRERLLDEGREQAEADDRPGHKP